MGRDREKIVLPWGQPEPLATPRGPWAWGVPAFHPWERQEGEGAGGLPGVWGETQTQFPLPQDWLLPCLSLSRVFAFISNAILTWSPRNRL